MSETSVKKEPGMATLVIVLFAICAVTALLLGLTNMVTAPYIAANNEKTTQQAMAKVLPADSYTEITDQYAGGDATVLNIYDAGEAGYVVQVKPATSFSGNLTVMVGVDPSGACTGISITSSGETSGLGSNASKPAFADQFIGKTGEVKVTKDGGDINAITGATITSRGVSEAVTSAIAAAASMG
ncbi:FMN-binding protein [uncultured Flavonifractor sp.]|uniref:FMN-binding protein n=1 Tax=uncultured Flavonifractor sp. TaxID=1193534 RepID=UPI0026173D4A|nr:FMN-binding protein [uncultured Flavonifractor sp.]